MDSYAKVHRVILCADGDSSDINLWSNIPYLLGAELERRCIELIRVNLQAPWLVRRLWRYSFGIRHKLRHWHTSVDFYRSQTNHWLTTRCLNQAIQRHGGPGTILINLSISAAPTLSTIPVVLLSDWSYHHYITTHLGRQPDRSEQATIGRDSAAMDRASLVVLLFPESAARLQQQIPAGRFRFLGHVINDHPLAPQSPLEPPAARPHRPWRLLFVGRPRYQEGLDLLLKALSLLPADQSVKLDVIGIGEGSLSTTSETQPQVKLHGYLNKADPTQRNTFYRLLNEADLILNTSSQWGGFSATVEAMHRYTAVLTAPYAEFQTIFGNEISFGHYLYELTPAAVAHAISAEIQDTDIIIEHQTCAPNAVQDFTWTLFVDRLLEELQHSMP